MRKSSIIGFFWSWKCRGFLGIGHLVVQSRFGERTVPEHNHITTSLIIRIGGHNDTRCRLTQVSDMSWNARYSLMYPARARKIVLACFVGIRWKQYRKVCFLITRSSKLSREEVFERTLMVGVSRYRYGVKRYGSSALPPYLFASDLWAFHPTPVVSIAHMRYSGFQIAGPDPSWWGSILKLSFNRPPYRGRLTWAVIPKILITNLSDRTCWRRLWERWSM